MTIYRMFILEIDANDNGVEQAPDMAYKSKTTLPVRVSNYNLPWNAPKDCKLT